MYACMCVCVCKCILYRAGNILALFNVSLPKLLDVIDDFHEQRLCDVVVCQDVVLSLYTVSSGCLI